ncbi:uricase [Strongylocentrotus purpuratus]|uniref:Uricase n=1 Tax=Strongylocentrotus purpuratus TaxID=7668 RepID=A0A7M7LLL2_STRPU|nr:uricase [Strongylocentrotus purpuratus]
MKMEFIPEETYYGKSAVKLLRLRAEGNVHHIKEFEVNVHLSLSSKKDFESGDNSDIIATDTQKNTVYALAKLVGVKSPEQFGQALCRHFLSSFRHVIAVRVHIEEAPWKRITQGGQEHVHAFVIEKQCTRFCDLLQERGGLVQVWAGLKDLKVLKTTQSGFVGFIRDKYTSLPEVTDRVFSTSVYARWRYATLYGLDEDKAWQLAKEAILDVFAGPPLTGVYSASVQHTLHLTQGKILQLIPQVSEVTMEMPNSHYFLADLKKIGLENNNEVLMPVDKPYGLIRASVKRSPTSKL